ncbi:hypothetical protein ACFY2W_23195 [Streptomyces sp. NPDC001262]|uniref:hypothetical protein n=1 Tax=Streptomyces sp. NPDC001262 TaxID=3364552 RepID=UPI0036B63731
MAISAEAAPRAAAYNIRRKLDLDVIPGPVLAIDHVPENEATGAKEGINFVFDGGTLTHPQAQSITLSFGVPSVDEPEIIAYKFMTNTDLLYLVSDYQRVRVLAAAQQRALGGIPYLHGGKPATKSAA